jgi:protein transport protein SEC61 subunit gamma-like protein
MFATADKREFLKISQAVGFGFLIMGAIGYFIKLSMSSAHPISGRGQFANS